jgi:hypothetical protein
MEIRPLDEIEKEIETNFKQEFINGISLDDLENSARALKEDLEELSPDITNVSIMYDDQSLDIIFKIFPDDYLHLFLERDEDGECYI